MAKTRPDVDGPVVGTDAVRVQQRQGDAIETEGDARVVGDDSLGGVNGKAVAVAFWAA